MNLTFFIFIVVVLPKYVKKLLKWLLKQLKSGNDFICLHSRPGKSSLDDFFSSQNLVNVIKHSTCISMRTSLRIKIMENLCLISPKFYWCKIWDHLMKGKMKMDFLKFINPSTFFSIWDHLRFMKPIQHLDIEGSWYHDNFDVVNLNIKNTGMDSVELLLKYSTLNKKYIWYHKPLIKSKSEKRFAFYFPDKITDATVLFKDANSKRYLILRIIKQNGKWEYKRGLMNQDYIEIEEA